jgi:hypothetical protein
MTPAVSTAIPTRWRRLVLATLLAGAATFATTSLVDPATACAAPRYWDIGFYDDCVAQQYANYERGWITWEEYAQAERDCCASSNGDWNFDTNECEAAQNHGPGARPQDRVPTVTAPDVGLPPPPPPTNVAPPAPVQPPAVG